MNGTGKTTFVQSMDFLSYTRHIVGGEAELYDSKDKDIQVFIHNDKPSYHDCDGVVLFFSLINPASLKTLREIAHRLVEMNIPCVAFGTHSDIAVGYLDIGSLESTFPNNVPIYFGSGQTGLNVSHCMHDLLRKMKYRKVEDTPKDIKQRRIEEILSELRSIILEE